MIKTIKLNNKTYEVLQKWYAMSSDTEFARIRNIETREIKIVKLNDKTK